MDRAHRRELKHDKFVEQVGHTVEYAAEHRKQFARWGGVALALLVLLGAWWVYRNHQHNLRQEALRAALRVQNAQIGPQGSAGEFFAVFPTEAEKQKAVEKTWRDLAAQHGGSEEGAIAQFYLGVLYSDQGKTAEAEKQFREVADSAPAPYASQAKLSLAQLYDATGRKAEAEKLLRDLMANPTIMVSKEQATIELARVIAPSKPDEARKLLEPLRTQPGAASRAALTALSQLPAR